MTTKQLRDTIAAQCGFNKAQQGEINKAKPYAVQVCNGGDWPESTSFSAWLEANGDLIEPLDRTEATTKWFDEKAEHENDLRHESRQDYETWERDGDTGPEQQGE